MVWGGEGEGCSIIQLCHSQGYRGHSTNPGDDTSSSKDKGVHIRLDYEEKHFFKYPIVEFTLRYGLKIRTEPSLSKIFSYVLNFFFFFKLKCLLIFQT